MVERRGPNDTLEEAYEDARADAIRAIEENKTAIERIASALLKRGDLTGDQVHRLIEQ